MEEAGETMTDEVGDEIRVLVVVEGHLAGSLLE